MKAATIFAELLACGIEPTVSPDGTGIVVPAGSLTADQRSAVLDHKADLLDYLRCIASHQIKDSKAAANDTTTPEAPADPDLWCWPHSEAMNTVEIDTFMARLARFTDKGLTLADAEREADRLVIRDRGAGTAWWSTFVEPLQCRSSP